jgi:membrane protease YdiL (CAAX protease family)
VFGTLVGVPWAVAVSGDRALAWRLAGSSLLQLVPACAVGVWLGPKVGLGSRLRGVFSRTPGAWKEVGRGLIPGILTGLAIGLVVLMGVSSMPEEALIPGAENPTISEVFLRCLSAGITEEITFRFGLMTFLAWMIRSGLRRPTSDATSLWVGNLLAALIFAVGHLPGLPPDARNPVFLIPILAINASGGMVMGWLFMRYGLVAAIGSHFVADVVHGVIPRLVALMG